MTNMIKLRWFCKHCKNCSGVIEIPRSLLGVDMDGAEIIKLINEQHDKIKTISGETWINLNFPDASIFDIYESNGKDIVRLKVTLDDFPIFMVLHIQ